MSDAELNWVDPDILAYFESEGGEMPTFDPAAERPFKEFFTTSWLNPVYDDIRETWDKLITSESSHRRWLGKTALWSVVQLRKGQPNIKPMAKEDNVA